MSVSSQGIEVTGEDVLVSGSNQELFQRGKDWILSYWEQRGRPVTSIRIENKLIGRNDGFILAVSISGPPVVVKYYAKVQPYWAETVVTHYFLKYAKTGPEEFLIVMLKPTIEHLYRTMGIITLEVPQFVMASALSKEVQLSSKNSLKESFLLSVLIALGHWTDIPYNPDNWGFVVDSSAIAERLVVVDFSSNQENTELDNADSFLTLWKETMSSMPCDAAYTAPRLCMLKDQLRRFAWLKSQDVFKALLQKVMHKTEEWLHQALKTETFAVSCTCATECTSKPVLTTFLHTRRLCTCQLKYVEHLLADYTEWVERWNKQCTAMFRWMPQKVKYGVKKVVVKQRLHLRRRTVKYVYYA